MIIKNTEALKNWLIIVLEPLCDADSSALARYVLALLKKDKQEKDLKKMMVEQLDVFLSEQTKPFVERLFDAIISEDYLQDLGEADDCEIVEVQPSKNKTVIKTDAQESVLLDMKYSPWSPKCGETFQGEKYEVFKKDENKELDIGVGSSTTINTVVKMEPSSNPNEPAETYKDRSVSPKTPRITADKENQPREYYRRRFAAQRSRSRSWSRDRSTERCQRRSRSKDRRITDREKNQRQFKNKSPNTEGRQLTPYERRRSGGDRRRGGPATGDRSPRFGSGGTNDTGRKGTVRARSQSRSISPSSERSGAKAAGKDVSPNKKSRCSPENNNTVTADIPEIRQRCRDFDEKGYCVRGETCPWDHGINPVVFEDVNNSSLLTMSLREYNPDAPEIWSRSGPSLPLSSTLPNPLGVNAPSINPFTGAIRPGNSLMAGVGGATANGNLPLTAADYTRSLAGGGFRPSGSIIPFPFNAAGMQAPLQRELIPIPVMDVNTATGTSSADINLPVKRRFDIDDGMGSSEGPSKRKIPINSRLGPRIASAQGNCSLELRKIPRGLNTIAHLNNHFAKFGKIVNIQVSYDGDPEAAIVTFSNHAEANVAYRSTEAVLNNRFIKVFWHNQDMSSGSGGDVAPISTARKSQYHLNNVVQASAAPTKQPKATESDSTIENNAASTVAPQENTAVSASHVTPNSVRHKTSTSRPIPNPTVLRKKQEQAKAVVQLANGLRKRKQELLQSYLKQMKSAVELVEKVEPNDPQRAKTLETIKSLQGSIDKLRKEIASEQEHLQAQIQNQTVPPKKTKEQAKKELLDIELELFAQQQEGNDTSAIQKRLEELQRSLGIGQSLSSPNLGTKGSIIPTKNLSFARGGRGRYSEHVSTRVDRRPKSIIVTGFATEEAETVLAHFKLFGEVVKHEIDEIVPQLTVHYTTRTIAEQAMLRGKVINDKTLQLSWPSGTVAATQHNSIQNKAQNNYKPTSPSYSPRLSPSLFDNISSKEQTENEAENTVDTLPELPLEDEEDDDETEDRSWRR